MVGGGGGGGGGGSGGGGRVRGCGSWRRSGGGGEGGNNLHSAAMVVRDLRKSNRVGIVGSLSLSCTNSIGCGGGGQSTLVLLRWHSGGGGIDGGDHENGGVGSSISWRRYLRSAAEDPRPRLRDV